MWFMPIMWIARQFSMDSPSEMDVQMDLILIPEAAAVYIVTGATTVYPSAIPLSKIVLL
jgi:hypothetical protein